MLELKKKDVNLDEVSEEECTESKKINVKKVAIVVGGVVLAAAAVVAIACGLKGQGDPVEELADVIDITDFNVADDE